MLERNPNYRSEWRKKHRERLRTQHITYRYGVTQAEYDAILTTQCGMCAICQEAFDTSETGTTPHVDHDHETGAIRGLLCRACNAGLGQFRDSLTNLESAIRYLCTTQAKKY